MKAVAQLGDLEAKLETLDVKDKVLIITTEEAIPRHDLSALRDKIKQLGGLAVLYLPSTTYVQAETIDICIEQLKALKARI